MGVIVTVKVVEVPDWIVLLAGVTEIEKSPTTLTTSVTSTEWETGPLVPVILSG